MILHEKEVAERSLVTSKLFTRCGVEDEDASSFIVLLQFLIQLARETADRRFGDDQPHL